MSAVDVLALLDKAGIQGCSCDTCGHSARARKFCEARTAVAALMEVATELLEYRVGTYPARGDLRDNAGSRAQIDALATALAACRGGK